MADDVAVPERADPAAESQAAREAAAARVARPYRAAIAVALEESEPEPELRRHSAATRYSAAFDRKYGKGMAAKILGGGTSVVSAGPRVRCTCGGGALKT